LLNCFTVGPKAETTLVDCPGYGYAAVSKATRGSWQRMIERYLLEREPLTMAMLLVDGEIGPTKLDLEVLDWLRTNAVPHSVVATKHDKVKSSKRARRERDLATLCMLEPSDVLWVSAAKNTGIDRLRDVVRLWLSLR
jgi:GTP-binding protein